MLIFNSTNVFFKKKKVIVINVAWIAGNKADIIALLETCLQRGVCVCLSPLGSGLVLTPSQVREQPLKVWSDDDAIDVYVRWKERGLAGRVTLSSGVSFQHMLVRNGGFGYAHVFRNLACRLPAGTVSLSFLSVVCFCFSCFPVFFPPPFSAFFPLLFLVLFCFILFIYFIYLFFAFLSRHLVSWWWLIRRVLSARLDNPRYNVQRNGRQSFVVEPARSQAHWANHMALCFLQQR